MKDSLQAAIAARGREGDAVVVADRLQDALADPRQVLDDLLIRREVVDAVALCGLALAQLLQAEVRR